MKQCAMNEPREIEYQKTSKLLYVNLYKRGFTCGVWGLILGVFIDPFRAGKLAVGQALSITTRRKQEARLTLL